MAGAYLGLRGPKLSTAIGIVAGLVFFLFGYDQGDMGGFMTISSFFAQFPPIRIPIGNKMNAARYIGFTIAVWNLGCFTSAMISIFIGDRLGRKKMMLMGLTFLLIGEIIQCSSFTWDQFVAGRFIAGIGNGFNCATVPAWQAECTKAHRRGTVLMISAGACIAAGLAFSYWVDFAFAWLDPNSAAWRVPIALQIFLIFVAMTILVFLPESPRWLILQGRENEARNVLSALNDLDAGDMQINQEFLQIKDTVVEMAKASFGSTFKMGDYRDVHRVVLAVVLQFFQQIGGINFMTQYFALMFAAQYLWDPSTARLLAACAGTEFLLATFIAVWGIDRMWGRRTLMLFGSTGMCITMIILTIMMYINTRTSLNVGTAFIFVFCTFFAIGWQGMSWLYQVEVVPLRIRGPANALSTGANWLANFIVVLISPVAFESTHYRTYIIFAVTNAVIIPTIYFLYPETSLRCLEEMDYIFHAANSSDHPWLDVRKIAADQPLWYGATGVDDAENPYDYEGSEWHRRYVRFSDEVKDSEGPPSTLNDLEKFGVGSSSESDGDGDGDGSKMQDSGRSAPSPVVPMTRREE